MIPKWFQNDPKMIPTWSQTYPKMIPKWSQNYPKMISKWSQNDFKMIPKFVYYSPGDRAQKVIPRGAKTNESFWKSQNNVKKSIVRFPTFLFSIALVIERKKLPPVARHKNESLWKSQNNVKKINCTFPNSLVYYSPGDRAQKVTPRGATKKRAPLKVSK